MIENEDDNINILPSKEKLLLNNHIETSPDISTNSKKENNLIISNNLENKELLKKSLNVNWLLN